MKEIIINILCAVGGCLGGISAGIGFWPKWNQPKNIRIQIVLGVVSIIILSIIAAIIL